MGKPVKIIDLARKMIQLAGYEPEKEIEIKVIGLRPGEKLYEELLNDTSKTLPTHHEKIMIAQEEEADFDKIIEDIGQLITIATCKEEVDIVQCMKKIVPEFKSLNSTYEMLD
jgi:FlaA1/EpsC-like NDP-sugar epimerase